MAAPKIEATVVDINPETIELTGDSSKLIKYHSHAKASMTVTSDSAINMDTCIISNGNEKNIGSKSYIFENVYKRIFYFSAKDAEDDYSTTSVIPEMVDYTRLTCAITNSKLEADGTVKLSCVGNWFGGDFGTTENTLKVTYSYTGSDRSSGSGNMTVDFNRDSNTYEAEVDLGLNYEIAYTFTVKAKDELEEVESSENVQSLPLFHWGKSDFTFEVPVQCNSNLRLQGTDDEKEYGNALYFGDGDYCCIKEETDDDMTIYARKGLKLSTYNTTINIDSLCGYWIPRLNHWNAVEEYRTQEGWYQRLGNVITIGWHLKATIEQGYSGKELKITFDTGELPKPSVSAFGGGVAFNIRTESDFIFEGWSIAYDDDDESDTYGMTVIAARLQRCEKASTGELQIASTCYYPDVPDDATTDEKTVTVAGTICYMTDD